MLLGEIPVPELSMLGAIGFTDDQLELAFQAQASEDFVYRLGALAEMREFIAPECSLGFLFQAQSRLIKVIKDVVVRPSAPLAVMESDL
jgi:hypothetical protein